MQIRRASQLIVEPRETVEFDMSSLLEGGDGLRATREWVVLASHLDAEVVVNAEDLAVLGAVSTAQWQPYAAETERFGARVIDRLLELGLLISDAPAHAAIRARDERLSATHWRALSAASHYFSRWTGIDTENEETRAGHRTMVELRDKFGAPPPHVAERGPASSRIALARPAPRALDEMLARRVTCRNFDRDSLLDAERFARMLERVCAAQATVAVTEDTVVMKKHSPSGGGLHPTEAYVIAQRVEGIAPGLYHYHPIDHALEPIELIARERLRALAGQWIAGQQYFADAHAIVVMTCRFARSFWKYRDHQKAYRAVVLDVGHLSMTNYLSATDLGLGAWVTAAVNEREIEAALGLDPLEQSPIALCGFGLRAARRADPEFDPHGRVWPNPG